MSIRSGHIVFLALLLFCIGMGSLGGLLFVHSTDLPQVRQLQDYRPDVITELYAADGTLIGSFALERRMVVEYDEIPEVLREAIISIEDRRFWDHWGLDVVGIARAAIVDISRWRLAQGASTITQLLTRVLFLSPDKRFRRKIEEALLAIQIERNFTKRQIFTLFCNQIFLGNGNYGFQAAAQHYFGKNLAELTLPEAALLAGLPQAPSAYSPLRYPERALARRNQVLDAMVSNGKISPQQAASARAAPLGVGVAEQEDDFARYFVEEIRKQLESKFGTATVHERGLRVHTTLDVKLQRIAQAALRGGLHVYDKRRGWRGAELNILQNPPTTAEGEPVTLLTYKHKDWERSIRPGDSVHGLITLVRPDHARFRMGPLRGRLTRPDFSWTGTMSPSRVFRPGDVVLLKVREISQGRVRVELDQKPLVQGALVALENRTGRILAMVGGYDFRESQFNRATQALRQAGSSFKPYLYSVALMQGLGPFDTIVDEEFTMEEAPGRIWAPQNYDRQFKGKITLLEALAESRNVPAVKLLQEVGIQNLVDLARKFGITSPLVPNLPLALGASEVLLLEHTAAFTAFPNDGIRVVPRYMEKVVSYHGGPIEEHPPQVVEVLPAPIARLALSMLREVVNSGTARRAKSLGLPVAGKTGTTNNYSDASFVGFSSSITCGVWVGFDDRQSLGPREEGARVALPIWMEFMEEAHKDRPAEDFTGSPLLEFPDQVGEILNSTGNPQEARGSSLEN